MPRENADEFGLCATIIFFTTQQLLLLNVKLKVAFSLSGKTALPLDNFSMIYMRLCLKLCVARVEIRVINYLQAAVGTIRGLKRGVSTRL